MNTSHNEKSFEAHSKPDQLVRSRASRSVEANSPTNNTSVQERIEDQTRQPYCGEITGEGDLRLRIRAALRARAPPYEKPTSVGLFAEDRNVLFMTTLNGVHCRCHVMGATKDRLYYRLLDDYGRPAAWLRYLQSPEAEQQLLKEYHAFEQAEYGVS